ncbi:hypothetical protein P9139_00155 [Curtobacterium flaccumfaciens]|nr:hypothetical protein P9139_00155 [Curtobacterium flaccumfaciens]
MAGIGSWGGGIVLLIAAVLWLVYLMPSWAARRQYLATERNAIRLQQTLRILAQTAELPDEVRVEMNAKSLAEAQRVARSEEAKRTAIVRAHEAARQREITRRLAEQAPVLERVSSVPALTAMRMRRSRLGRRCSAPPASSSRSSSSSRRRPSGSSASPGSSRPQAPQPSSRSCTRSRRHGRRVPRRSCRRCAVPPGRRTSGRTRRRRCRPSSPPSPRATAPGPEHRAEAALRGASGGPAASPESAAELAARLKERVAEAKAEAEAEAAAIRAAETDPSLARVSPMRPDVEEAVASLSAHDQGRLAERLGLRAPAAIDAAPAEPAAPAEASPPAPPSRWAGMGVLDDDAYQQADLDAIMRRRRAV